MFFASSNGRSSCWYTKLVNLQASHAPLAPYNYILGDVAIIPPFPMLISLWLIYKSAGKLIDIHHLCMQRRMQYANQVMSRTMSLTKKAVLNFAACRSVVYLIRSYLPTYRKLLDLNINSVLASMMRTSKFQKHANLES